MREREQQLPRFGAIVVHGKNIGVNSTAEDIRNDNFQLSTDSRITAIAAGMLWEPEIKLILSTGVTASGLDRRGKPMVSEAQAMKNYIQKKFNIPDDAFELEEKSIDTAGNAQEVAEILKKRGFKRVAVVTVGYHKDNAVKLFSNFGVKVEKAFASEEILARRSRHHEHFVKRWKESDRVKREKGKEKFRRILIYTVDPKGLLLRQITSRTRGA